MKDGDIVYVEGLVKKDQYGEGFNILLLDKREEPIYRTVTSADILRVKEVEGNDRS